MIHRNELLFALTSGLAASAAIAFLPALVAKPKMLFGRSLSAMEPSLFPYITLSLIVALSILLLLYAGRAYFLASRRDTAGTEHAEPGENSISKIAVFFMVLVSYGLLLKPVGFLISSFLVISTLSLLLGNRNWLQIILFALLCPVCLYLIATRGMLVSLPELDQIELLYASVINRFSG